MKRLKVGFVTQPRANIVPGELHSSISVWTCEVARRLAKSCDVAVFGLRRKGQAALEDDRGVRYRRFRIRHDRRLLEYVKRLRRFPNPRRPLFASPLYFLIYAVRAALALRAGRFDVAHVQNWPQFVPIIRAFNPRIQIVLHMHTEWLTQLDRGVIARRLRAADAIVACSPQIAKKISARFPEFADRCHVVLNGADTARFSPASRPPQATGPGEQPGRGEEAPEERVLFVGRVSPEKGVHVLLDAFAEVLRRHPGARLDIVGPVRECPPDYLVAVSDDAQTRGLAQFYDDRGYKAHLDGLIDSLGLAGRVRWRGPVMHELLAGHYQSADVFVSLSFSEGLGMACLEAMAAGAPVVACMVGGFVEVVEEGRTGLLVPPGDSQALAAAICRLLSDPQLARSMGAAGRQRVLQYFSWDAIAAGTLRLYVKLCRSSR